MIGPDDEQPAGSRQRVGRNRRERLDEQVDVLARNEPPHRAHDEVVGAEAEGLPRPFPIRAAGVEAIEVDTREDQFHAPRVDPEFLRARDHRVAQRRRLGHHPLEVALVGDLADQRGPVEPLDHHRHAGRPPRRGGVAPAEDERRLDPVAPQRRRESLAPGPLLVAVLLGPAGGGSHGIA